MIVLSRKVGQTLYIQPLIGDLLVVKVLSVFIRNSVKVVRLCIQKLNLEKIAPRIQKGVAIRNKRKRIFSLNEASTSSTKPRGGDILHVAHPSLSVNPKKGMSHD